MDIREREGYMTLLGKGIPGTRIPHWEAWSNPDAETYLTGIEYYEHPRLCRLKTAEWYSDLGLGIPENVFFLDMKNTSLC